jgi:protein involved in sex pheromone biosynthesis
MKRIIFLTAFTTLLLTACKKSSGDANPTPGDEIIGKYAGQEYSIIPPANIQIEAYKIEKYKFGLRKLSPAGFPDFTFNLNTDLFLVENLLGLR